MILGKSIKREINFGDINDIILTQIRTELLRCVGVHTFHLMLSLISSYIWYIINEPIYWLINKRLLDELG